MNHLLDDPTPSRGTDPIVLNAVPTTDHNTESVGGAGNTLLGLFDAKVAILRRGSKCAANDRFFSHVPLALLCPLKPLSSEGGKVEESSI